VRLLEEDMLTNDNMTQKWLCGAQDPAQGTSDGSAADIWIALRLATMLTRDTSATRTLLAYPACIGPAAEHPIPGGKLLQPVRFFSWCSSC